jgi:hypothetical protein
MSAGMRTDSRSPRTATLTGRLLGSRGVVFYLILLAAAPLLVTRAALVLERVLSRPSTGLYLNPRATVETTDPRWPGVRLDDRVVSINGIPVDDAELWKPFVKPGPLEVRFRRGDSEWVQRASTSGWSGLYRGAVWFRLIVGALLFAIGLAAFLVRPGQLVSWLFLLFSYILGVLSLLGWLFEDGHLIYDVQYLLMPLGSSIVLHLFCLFPRPADFLAGRRVRVALLYLPPLVLPPLAWPYLAHPGSRLFAIAPQLCWLWSVGATLLALANLIYQHRRAKKAQDRRLMSLYRTVIAGVVLGLLAPTVVLTGIMVFGRLADGRWLFETGVGGFFLFALATTWALLRHNAFEVDRFTAALVGYALTLGVMVTVFVLLLFGLPWLIGRAGMASSPPVLVGVTAAVILGAGPLYRRLRTVVDRWFLRSAVDAGQHMQILEQLAIRIQDIFDRDAALDCVLQAADTLKAERVEVWLLTDDAQGFRRLRSQPAAGPGTTLDRSSPLALALAQGQSGGVNGLASRGLSPEAQESLWSLELAAATPVRVHGEVMGFLGLGRKLAGTRFSDEETVFMNTLAAQLGIVLARAGAESTRFGRYRTEKRLGVGGMAEVFLAWQTGPGGFERRVALKRPLPELVEDPASVSMFLDEARIAAHLQHRNIAQIYEIDQHEGTYFLAMEYVDGPSLRTLLRRSSRNKPIPLPVVLSLASSVLSAIGHAHAQKDSAGRPLEVVHRDVTPSNILLTTNGDVKLVDFGIARASSRLSRTRTGVVRGTLPYMSPEQAAGRPLDGRSDLYSVGSVLYELLTLERAFPAGPTVQGPPPASGWQPALSAAVDQVIARALAHEPQDRFATAEQFRAALLAALAPLQPADDTAVAAWLRSLEPEEPVAAPAAPAPSAPPVERATSPGRVKPVTETTLDVKPSDES